MFCKLLIFSKHMIVSMGPPLDTFANNSFKELVDLNMKIPSTF